MSFITSTLSFRLFGIPTWVWIIIALAVWHLYKTVTTELMNRRLEREYALIKRRQQGIPDSDKRPWNIAAADADRRYEEKWAIRRKEEADERQRRNLEQKRKDLESWERRVGDLVNESQRRRTDFEQPKGTPRMVVELASASNVRPSSRQQPLYEQYLSPPKPNPPRFTNRPTPLQVLSKPSWRASSSHIPSIRPPPPSKKRDRSNSDPEDENLAQQPQVKSLRFRKDSGGVTSPSEKRVPQTSSRGQHDIKMEDAEPSESVLEEDGQYQRMQDGDEDMRSESGDREGEDDAQSDPMAVDEAERLSQIRQGKKRVIDDVEAESTVTGSWGRTRNGGSGKRRRSRQSYEGENDRQPQSIEDPEESQQDAPRRPKRQVRIVSRPTPSKTPKIATNLSPVQVAKPEFKEHVPGDEWTDASGTQWKKAPNGTPLRLAVVKEERNKFTMPRDSVHPDASAKVHIDVEKWLTPEQYEKAKEYKLLSWQAEESNSSSSLVQSAPGPSLLASELRSFGSTSSLKAGNRNFTPLRRSIIASQSPGLRNLSFSPSSLSRSSSTISLARGVAGNGTTPGRTPATSRSILGSAIPERRQLSEAGRLQRRESLLKQLRPSCVSTNSADELPGRDTSGRAVPTSSETLYNVPEPAMSGEAPPVGSDQTVVTQQDGSAPPSDIAPAATISFVGPDAKGKGFDPLEKQPLSGTPSFSFGSDPSTASRPATTAPSFSFGSDETAKSAEEKSPAITPSFSFEGSEGPRSNGNKSSGTAQPTSHSTVPSFMFGASATPTPAAPHSSTPIFGFGDDPTTSSPAFTPSVPVPTAASPTVAQPSSAPTISTFTFSASPASASSQHTWTTPSFAFGSNATQPIAPAPQSITPSFSFGSQPSQPSTQAPSTPGTSSTAFTFGSSAPAPTASTFIFGSPATTPTTNPASQPGFSLGVAPPSKPSVGAGSRPMRRIRSRPGAISGTPTSSPGAVGSGISGTPTSSARAVGSDSDTSMASNRSASPVTLNFGETKSSGAEAGGYSSDVSMASKRSASPATFSFGAAAATPADGNGDRSTFGSNGKRGADLEEKRTDKKPFTFGSS